MVQDHSRNEQGVWPWYISMLRWLSKQSPARKA